MHSGEMEIMLARHLNPRINLIVPNVFWGLGLYHEADLLVLTPSKYAWEIEIKVSLSDLKADKKKKHGHCSDKVRRLYFAVPQDLKEKALVCIPERAGLFIVTNEHRQNGVVIKRHVRLARAPKTNTTARKLDSGEIKKLYELAAMRLWSLKEKNYNLQKRIKKET